jgi:hypothetical protein
VEEEAGDLFLDEAAESGWPRPACRRRGFPTFPFSDTRPIGIKFNLWAGGMNLARMLVAVKLLERNSEWMT